MTASLVAVTVYTATIGTRLFCDTGDTNFSFDLDPEIAWLAWAFDTYGGQCGDIIVVWIDGIRYDFVALDSGGFGPHCVRQRDGSCPPIMADLPMHLAPFEGLSALAQVVNVSESRRRWEQWR